MPAELFREKIDREAGQPGAWDGMLASVRVLLRELLAAAAPHIAGGRPFARGRALYGVDVMFTRDLKPKLLEVTFCPGVERPMAADPEFLNKASGFFSLPMHVRKGCMCRSAEQRLTILASSSHPFARAGVWRTVQRRDGGRDEPVVAEVHAKARRACWRRRRLVVIISALILLLDMPLCCLTAIETVLLRRCCGVLLLPPRHSTIVGAAGGVVAVRANEHHMRRPRPRRAAAAQARR